MDVIISVRPEYVRRIAAGEKSIEVRTKRPNLSVDDTIWIYEKLPIGHISIRARVEKLETIGLEAAWRAYRDEIAISRQEYLEYLDGRKVISLIFLKTIRVLNAPVSLEQLRKLHSDFSPPQFMRKVREPALMRRLAASV